MSKKKNQPADASENGEHENGQEESSSKVIEITAATLKSIFCNYQYKHTVAPNTTNDVKIKSEVPVHEDLTAAFKGLNAHLAVICEEVKPADIDDITAIEDYDESGHKEDSLEYQVALFHATGFSLHGIDENTSVILTGYKKLSTGDLLQLQTPKIKLHQDYPFATELQESIDKCVTEVEQYLNGKQAPPQQLKLDIPESEQEPEFAETGL